MPLLLIADRHGAPLGYDLRPANENEREDVYKLATAHPGSLLFAEAVTEAASITAAWD